MLCSPEIAAQHQRMQAARRLVVVEAESLAARGLASPELIEALRVHTEELRTFENMVDP
jgi:hypothetical protein